MSMGRYDAALAELDTAARLEPAQDLYRTRKQELLKLMKASRSNPATGGLVQDLCARSQNGKGINPERNSLPCIVRFWPSAAMHYRAIASMNCRASANRPTRPKMFLD